MGNQASRVYGALGNSVSRVYGAVVKRPLQRYNVEHRAEKVINKIQDPDAPAMRSPMYQSDAALLDEIRKTNPGMAESAVRRDGSLHQRLKSVYVESTDPVLEESSSHPIHAKNLPKDTAQYSYDFVPAQLRLDTDQQARRTLPRGKVTIGQAVDFLTRFKETRGTFDHGAIADQYRLNPETTKHAVDYFTIFNITETKTRESESTPPDPLVAGKDWVEKLQKPVDPIGHFKKRKEEENLMLSKQNTRSAQERMINEGKKGDDRTD